jgi:predicted enzyme related to lactoylglutathione lyase
MFDILKMMHFNPQTAGAFYPQIDTMIAIHGGGEGKRTWTGITFQVPDVVGGAAEVVAAGGRCEREPEWEDGQPPHLAMCEDTEGNQIMLSRRRS